MWAFCAPSALPSVLSRGAASQGTRRPRRQSVIVAKKSSSKSPRSESNTTSGFGTGQNEALAQEQPSQAAQFSKTTAQDKDTSGVDLKSVDKDGISLEHRLKEEIKHPLRKPKQTLFATLSFSALLASLIAISRFISHADSIQQFSINLLINVTGVTTFGYLTWRQVQFGRRALNSIAGRPQLRDLPIISASSSPTLPSWLRSAKRMSTLLRRSDVMVLVGKRTLLEAYLYRCKGVSNVFPLSLVLFPTDINSIDGQYPIQPDAFADRESDGDADWKAWMAEISPSRRNMVVLRISINDQGTQPPAAYVVEGGDAKSISLPTELSRPNSESQ